MSEQETATADFVERIIQRDELKAALSQLTRRERAVCTLFGAGYRWREIGQQLGLAGDTSRMIFRRAIARIRHEVSGGGNPIVVQRFRAALVGASFVVVHFANRSS